MSAITTATPTVQQVDVEGAIEDPRITGDAGVKQAAAEEVKREIANNAGAEIRAAV